MKLFMAALLCVSVSGANATPYVEFKTKQKFINDNYDNTANHLRLGFKADNNLYFEAGPMTDGYSAEIGYKVKFNNSFTLKGKWEGEDTNRLKHGFETELRYTFDQEII